jgi:hypothetical protein
MVGELLGRAGCGHVAMMALRSDNLVGKFKTLERMGRGKPTSRSPRLGGSVPTGESTTPKHVLVPPPVVAKDERNSVASGVEVRKARAHGFYSAERCD